MQNNNPGKLVFTTETPDGTLNIHETQNFGLILTINDQLILSEADGFFSTEMLVHPALFTHPRPESVAIIGHSFGLLTEVLKHPSVKHIYLDRKEKDVAQIIHDYFPIFADQFSTDPRIQHDHEKAHNIDVIIQQNLGQNILAINHLESIFAALNDQGMAVIPCPTSLLQFNLIKPIWQQLEKAGFRNIQPIQYPQPSDPLGWRTLLLSSKNVTIKRVREKDIFNRNFTTRYYNYDIHKAALAMPEFVREEIS